MTSGTTVKGVDNLYFRDGRYDEGFANNKVDHDVRYYGEWFANNKVDHDVRYYGEGC